LDMIESTKISQRYELTESSTLYFRLPRGNYKLEVNTTNDLQVVKASKILGLFVPNQYSWKIQTDTKKIVIDEKEEAYLILVNPSMKRQSLILSLQLKN